ncbi:MAG: phosphate acyltransferase PlsX [Gammaproteobacteria bacterium]|nr:phosphate acyltransferase PlsX [Gammaproteobacteria bacterium]
MNTVNSNKTIIAVDAMSGDKGVPTTVAASIDVLKTESDIHLILVGDETLIAHELSVFPESLRQNISIQHASQIVSMDDKPAIALRMKKDSSMRISINLVKENKAKACVSAGNTGALMATARFVLKMLPGIDRPAICTALPTMKGHTHMLDLGANIDLSAEHLYEFAVMGSVLTQAVDNINSPSIGLLNIGEEELKGNEQVKSAAKLLNESPLNYFGFVEGDDIYKGTVNVVVCDGFIGNIALKTSEGVAKMISYYLKRAFKKNILTKFVALLCLPVLNDFKKQVDPSEYNGASLLGLKGIVIKSHGGADQRGFAQAIREAIIEAKKDVPQLISKQIENTMGNHHN